MSDRDQTYSNIVTMLEGLLDFHPNMATSISTADRELLTRYYFFNRPIGVENIFDYRRHLDNTEPQLAIQAEAALHRFLAVNHVQFDPDSSSR